MYSPFSMHKHEAPAMQPVFAPQVPPPPFPMSRCNTSITSSNASFYFPPHAMPGGGPPAPPTGPLPACQYMADNSDPIDMMLSVGLAALDRASSSKLILRRLGRGKYEIDGRRVSLRWAEQQGNPGLLVSEDEIADSMGSEMPLIAYLTQAGNVAASLSGQRADMPKIARIPKEQRLTFADASGKGGSTADLDNVGNERCESMRIACEQARLREQAAEMYEHGMQGPCRGFPQRTLPPPPGLPLPYLN